VAQNSTDRPPANTRERVQNFLLYGFILSIALHLLVGPLVKFERTQPEEEKISKITRDRVPTPPPTPPPTPVPTPPPTPKPTPTPPPPTPQPKTPPPVVHTAPPQPKIKINTLHTTAVKGGKTEAANTHTVGSTNGVPTGTTTAAAATPVQAAPAAPPATPAATKPPACANPNVEATTTNAVAPDTPPIAQQQGITGVVNVVIQLDVNSKIVGTPTVQSSPSQLLNEAAIKAAEESTFRTEIKNCQPIAATYIFAVEFNNN
jgi:TonB family protein